MEFVSLDRLPHAGWRDFSWMPGSDSSPKDERIRVRRRERTMGYLYFLLILAASGVIIALIGHRSLSGKRMKTSTQSISEAEHSLDDSFLALRRSAIRQPAAESSDTDFVKRVDVWQKEHQIRNAWFNTNMESITGTKYKYTPPPKRRSAADSSR